MNPATATDTLNRFLYEGYADGLFRHVNTHLVVEGRDRTMSVGPAMEVGMIATHGLTYREFIRLVSEERYSAILSDYALLTLEWEMKRGVITRHRYMYIPCPIKPEILAEKPLEIEIADYFEQLDQASLVSNFLSHGYVRFDYTTDLVSSDIHHPLAHMTVISSDCRLALRSPISVSEFLTFVFDNFYPQHSPKWIDFQPHLKTECDDTIRPGEMSRMHLYWADEH
jgi:hypothetical protein